MFSCCALHNEAKEEVVSDSAITGERFEAAQQPLRVKASAIGPESGQQRTLLSCEVPGRAASKVMGPSPLAAQITSYSSGEPLRFGLIGENSSTPVGQVIMQPSVFQRNGFTGELALEDASGKTISYLLVSVTGEDGITYPPEPAAATGYRANVEVKPESEEEMGLDIDLMDRVYARISGIRPGPFQSYNERVGALQRVQVDDFIYSVNGCKWSKEFAQLFKQGKSLSVIAKRPLKYSVVVAKRNGTLGLDLWYEHDSSPALLVTKVNEGAVSQWNMDHPDRRLERFDRIVAVNGQGGNAAALLQLIREASDRLDLASVRPAADGPSSGPVDVSSLTKMAANDLGLIPQPQSPRARAAIIQVFVRSHDRGGVDKSANGHRYDSVPLANGLITSGVSCQLLHYVHQEHDQFFEVCGRFDLLILRCVPGEILADGGDQVMFDNALRQLGRKGVLLWPSPEIADRMSNKQALAQLEGQRIGLEGTVASSSAADFAAALKRALAFRPQVVKASHSMSGEGVWVVRLKDGTYCGSLGDRLCSDSEVLLLTEASDNHEESHSLAEFLEFCMNGRTDKAGTWASPGLGAYLKKGSLVLQQFCPRVVEGELQYNMMGDTCVGILHKKPKEGSLSALESAGATCTLFAADEERFASHTSKFLQQDLPALLPALGLANDPLLLPAWWSVEFLLASPAGTPASDERWIVGELDCRCSSLPKCSAAIASPSRPGAGHSDIPAVDRAEAVRLGQMLGQKALVMLGQKGN